MLRILDWGNYLHHKLQIFLILEWFAFTWRLGIISSNFWPLDVLPTRVRQSSLSLIFDLWYPQGFTKARFHFRPLVSARFYQSSLSFSTFGTRKGPSKLAFINFRPLVPARVHQSSLSFSTFGARKGSPKLAFIFDLWCRKGLPKLAFIFDIWILARVHQSSTSSIFDLWRLARVHQSSLSSIFDHWTACLQGSTKARLHQFSTFGGSQEFTKARFNQFLTFGWLARVHQSSLNYEDEVTTSPAPTWRRTLMIGTWKLLTLSGLTCWHCPQFKEDVGNLKEEVKPLLLPIWMRTSCHCCRQLKGGGHVSRT